MCLTVSCIRPTPFMTSPSPYVAFITSPLEYEYVKRIREAAPEGVEILYEPDLLPQTRYIADHKGRDGFARTPAQDRRWRDALTQATILWDFPSGPDGTRGLSLTPQVKWVQTTSSGVGQAGHSIDAPSFAARPASLVTQGRLCHGGRCRMC